MKFGKQFLILMLFFISFTNVVLADTVSLNLFYDNEEHLYTANETYIEINGERLLDLLMPPVIIEDRTLVPARAVFENLGAEVSYEKSNNSVTIKKDSDIIILYIDNIIAYKNGEPFGFDVAPKIINDSTMLPVRAIADALDCEVLWDDENRIVSIETGKVTSYEDLISINDIYIPTENGESFSINSSEQILDYVVYTSDDSKIIIDINNSINKIEQTKYEVLNNNVVTAIRLSQFSISPEYISRFVFDINESSKYEVFLSEDNKKILVSFEEDIFIEEDLNEELTDEEVLNDEELEEVIFEIFIEKFDFLNVGDKEVLYIEGLDYDLIIGEFNESINAYKFNIKNAELGDAEGIYNYSSNKYVRKVEFNQVNNDIDIIVYLFEKTNYSVVTSNKNAMITFSPDEELPTLPNDEKEDESETEEDIKDDVAGLVPTEKKWDNSVPAMTFDTNKNMLKIQKAPDIDIDSIIHTDNYLNNEYTLTLNGNYSKYYYNEKLAVDNVYVNHYEFFIDENNNTNIKFYQNMIMCYIVEDHDDYFYIRAIQPKEIYDAVVLLDAGHGGTDPGAIVNNLQEKEINLSIVLKMYEKMKAYPNIKVYLVRDDDYYIQNSMRAHIANNAADVFISIHANSIYPNPTPNGIEVLYSNHENDVAGNLTSAVLAKFLLDYTIVATSANNRGLKYRSDLVVLNSTTIPAALVEVGFMSNTSEAEKLATDSYREILADSMCSAIVDMFNQYPRK